MSEPIDPVAEVIAGKGHNNPPIKERLAVDHAEVLESVEEIAARANSAPKEIEDDTASNSISQIVKDANGAIKNLEALRVKEKEPFLSAGKEVDGFFKQFSERLTRIVTLMNRRNTEYLQAKAAEERRQRELEAQRRREIEAEERAEAARKLREAEELERQALEKSRKEERDLAELRRDQAEVNRRLNDAQASEHRADQARVNAQSAERELLAKPADLARTRGEETLTTLRTEWVFDIVDFNAIPISVLHPYISRDAIEKAIRAYVRVGGRQLAGVRVYQESKAVVR